MKVLFNEDWLHFWSITYAAGREISKETALEYINRYKNSNITDFILNVNGTVSSSDSEIFETWSDKYENETENGVKVDFKDTFAKTHHAFFKKEKIDVYKLWIDTLWEMGIRPYISFRMNDVHGDYEGFTNLLKSGMVEKHPDWWVSRKRKNFFTTEFDRAFDYGIKEVRDLYFSYIKEQLERYDVYGIELDFTREPYCFAEGEEAKGIPVMLEFVKSVKEFCTDIGKKRGREIKLGLLCPAEPEMCYKFGFDIPKMSKLGLLDYVAASPRWQTVNNDIPVNLWRGLLGVKTEFGCVQQLLVNGSQSNGHKIINPDIAFGQAHNYISKGNDFIYLYNYFYEAEPWLVSDLHSTCIREEKLNRFTVENISNPQNFDRRYPVTFDDFMPFGRDIKSQLPLYVKKDNGTLYDNGKLLRIPMCREEKSDKMYLIISLKSPLLNPQSLKVLINGSAAVLSADNKADTNITPENTYTFSFSADIDGDAVVYFNSDEDFVIEYAEIFVCNVIEK